MTDRTEVYTVGGKITYTINTIIAIIAVLHAYNASWAFGDLNFLNLRYILLIIAT